MSDELGPTSYNTIEGNLVEENESDCGITIVGHNAKGVNAKAFRSRVLGVFGNSSRPMWSSATYDRRRWCILLAGPASYNNTITDNQITGNGLAGVDDPMTRRRCPERRVISGNWLERTTITATPHAGQVTTGVFVERDSPKFRLSTSREEQHDRVDGHWHLRHHRRTRPPPEAATSSSMSRGREAVT